MGRMVLPCQALVSGGISVGPAITWNTARPGIIVIMFAPTATVMGIIPALVRDFEPNKPTTLSEYVTKLEANQGKG